MALSEKQSDANPRPVEVSPSTWPGEIDRRRGIERQTSTLMGVIRLINSSLEIEKVLERTLEGATQVMDAEAGSVILLDKSSDDLVIMVATGPKGHETRQKRIRKGEGIAGWVAETGEPRIVSNVRQNAHFFEGIDRMTGFTTRSILAVPLRVKEELIGVLEVINKRGEQGFDDRDLKLFMAFADLAAIHIDNAGAYEELRVAHRRLQVRLELERVVIGQSPAMREVTQQIDRVARPPVTVLLYGETGTGKSLIARVIHDRSPRRDCPFMTVDCGTLAAGLLESELFGHKKGAFTGAVQDKPGLFEAADGGTIFLDEVGNTPLELQTRLLRVLEEGMIRRVGETQDRQVDVRLIAATNQNLEQAVQEKTFREDLFFRLNVVPIVLPPLRKRIEDLPFLVTYFIEKYNQKLNGEVEEVSPEAMRALLTYPWPGNIRELEHVVERVIVMAEERTIRLEHLPTEVLSFASGEQKTTLDMTHSTPAAPDDQTLESMERTQITWALAKVKGNQSYAARLLGISREKLRYRIRKYGLEGRRGRA